MPVFISYSHEDKGFVDKLAGHLILSKVHVWVDRWELNVGDSIIAKIQQVIQEASALIVVLLACLRAIRMVQERAERRIDSGA